MATYKFIGVPGAGVPAFSQTVTYGTAAGQQAPVQFGHVADAFDATLGYGKFIFVAGSTNAKGELVQLYGNTAKRAGSGTLTAGRLGFAAAAMSATNVAGWVQVYGAFDSAIHSAAAADGVLLKMGTSAGHIDVRTATNDGYQVLNAFQQGSNTASNVGTVFCNFPYWKAVTAP